jgi:hypothetical protein
MPRSPFRPTLPVFNRRYPFSTAVHCFLPALPRPFQPPRTAPNHPRSTMTAASSRTAPLFPTHRPLCGSHPHLFSGLRPEHVGQRTEPNHGPFLGACDEPSKSSSIHHSANRVNWYSSSSHPPVHRQPSSTTAQLTIHHHVSPPTSHHRGSTKYCRRNPEVGAKQALARDCWWQ